MSYVLQLITDQQDKKCAISNLDELTDWNDALQIQDIVIVFEKMMKTNA